MDGGDPVTWASHLIPLPVDTSRKLEAEAEPGFAPKYSAVRWGPPKEHLIIVPNSCPKMTFLKWCLGGKVATRDTCVPCRLLIQLPVGVHSGREQVMAEARMSLLATQESRTKFWVPAFSWVQTWML